MKHAYLITAYNNFSVLSMLLKTLDAEDNIIFLHVDAKVDFDSETFVKQENLQKAEFYLTPRYDLTWADVSEISCVLNCMEFILKKTGGGDTLYPLHYRKRPATKNTKGNSRVF